MMSACPSGRDQRQSGLTAHEMPLWDFFLLCFGGISFRGVVTNRDRHFLFMKWRIMAVRLNYRNHAAEGNFRRILVELRKTEKWGMEENRR